jgi:hypothetical protein
VPLKLETCYKRVNGKETEESSAQRRHQGETLSNSSKEVKAVEKGKELGSEEGKSIGSGLVR